LSSFLLSKKSLKKSQGKTRQTEQQLRKKNIETGNELLSDLIQNHEHTPNRKQGKRMPLDIIYDQKFHYI